MKKIFSLISICLLTLLLTACGTTTESENSDQLAPTTETKGIEETSNSSNSEEELSGTVIESDHYTITVVDDFDLTSEEPNKDLLFNQENDLQSMRIETFNVKEANLNDVTKNLVETLQASNDNSTVVEITDPKLIPKSQFIEEAKAYQIETPDGKVTGYTFVREELIVKLIVFDVNESPALETFVKMAETIKGK